MAKIININDSNTGFVGLTLLYPNNRTRCVWFEKGSFMNMCGNLWDETNTVDFTEDENWDVDIDAFGAEYLYRRE